MLQKKHGMWVSFRHSFPGNESHKLSSVGQERGHSKKLMSEKFIAVAVGANECDFLSTSFQCWETCQACLTLGSAAEKRGI